MLFGLCTILISRDLAPISNWKWIARRDVHRTHCVPELLSMLYEISKRVGPALIMEGIDEIVTELIKNVNYYYNESRSAKIWYPMFYNGTRRKKNKCDWVRENHETFLKSASNKIMYNRWFFSECGFITSLIYSPNGSRIIVGHSSGLIQVCWKFRPKFQAKFRQGIML
jgi:hypothetical protein